MELAPLVLLAMVTGGITGYQCEKENEPAATCLAAGVSLYMPVVKVTVAVFSVLILSRFAY